MRRRDTRRAGRELGDPMRPLTLRTLPPLCADVGLVPIKTRAVQIAEFCALKRQRVVTAAKGDIGLIASARKPQSA